MPDRFDLMNTRDIKSAFRITTEYCKLVNPARLSEDDVERLDRGRIWLQDLTEALRQALDSGSFDANTIDPPQPDRQPSTSVEEALQQFAAANAQAGDLSSNHLTSSPKATLPTPRGSTSYLDLARHLARISNCCSVDQRWIWGDVAR